METFRHAQCGCDLLIQVRPALGAPTGDHHNIGPSTALGIGITVKWAGGRASVPLSREPTPSEGGGALGLPHFMQCVQGSNRVNHGHSRAPEHLGTVQNFDTNAWQWMR